MIGPDEYCAHIEQYLEPMARPTVTSVPLYRADLGQHPSPRPDPGFDPAIVKAFENPELTDLRKLLIVGKYCGDLTFRELGGLVGMHHEEVRRELEKAIKIFREGVLSG